jgi:hypothetical protein
MVPKSRLFIYTYICTERRGGEGGRGRGRKRGWRERERETKRERNGRRRKGTREGGNEGGKETNIDTSEYNISASVKQVIEHLELLSTSTRESVGQLKLCNITAEKVLHTKKNIERKKVRVKGKKLMGKV